jgi:TetR/AcrR family transcriptional regulator, transcriptional repressor for nem operon
MAAVEAPEQKLTKKGLATRERIVEAAAQLIYAHGVQNTNNELVRKAAGVSGSQLSRHFPTKESLVRAVIAWRANLMIKTHQQSAMSPIDSFAALRRWADSLIAREELSQGGCPFGSLASEVIKSDPGVRGDVVQGFDEWVDVFRSGLRMMRERGDLSEDADPEQLAYTLASAYQGGMLLDQAAGNAEPLRAALDGAIAHIETFASGKALSEATERQ